MPVAFESRHSPPFSKPPADAQMSASSSYVFFHSRENIPVIRQAVRNVTKIGNEKRQTKRQGGINVGIR